MAAAGARMRALEQRLASDPELERPVAEAGQAARAQRDADSAVAVAEGESAVVRQRARVVDRQLYDGSVRNPHDLLVLQRELEDLRARLASMEDTQLELMQRAEEAAARRAQADAELAGQRTRRDQELPALREQLDGARATAAIAAEERTNAAAALDSSKLDLYGRVAARRHPAVVRLSGDACGGCRLPLGTGEVRGVRQGRDVVQCSSCDRILVP